MNKRRTQPTGEAVGPRLDAPVRRREVFVPHEGCTVASGDCAIDGECLGDCRPLFKGLLPERLMRFTLRDLKAQRQALNGFVALGNELDRAREYDKWIEALERYCAQYMAPNAELTGRPPGGGN